MTKSLFKNILVVQDAYRDSIDAIECAEQLADGTSRICIMDIEPNLGSLWQELFNDEFDETPYIHRQKALRELVKGSNIAEVSKSVSTKVAKGRPIVKIVQDVISSHRDLIIKQAYAKYSDFLFGSLDMRLIRYAPTPVLLTQSGVKDYHRILVAINPEADEKEMHLNLRLIRQASMLSQGLHAKLYVVAAYHGHSVSYRRMEGPPDKYEKYSREIRRKCRRHLNEIFERASFLIDPNKVILDDGLADEVILSAVEQIDPDLIVIGSIARHGISGLLIGNTAENVLRRVSCSVLTVKPTDFASPITLGDEGQAETIKFQTAI